jgi:L-alanine-DL-glutamate epimerase-like enolase superfamily enzyme
VTRPALHSRREFLRRAALGGTAALVGFRYPRPGHFRPVRIAKIEAFPIVYPMVGRFKFFEGPEGSPTGRSAVMVKITTDGGLVGWGESVPIPKWTYETRETVASTIRNYLAPELIGHDVFDIAGAHDVMDHNIAPAFSTGQPMAKAGIDLALHDLVGKLLNQPLAPIWGHPSGGTITLSWTLNPRDLSEVEGLIEQGRERGYRHFNVKVSPDPKVDVALCRMVKERVPDGFLWADANGGYDPVTALQVAPKLADVGVDVLEQPLRPNRLDGFRDLKRQGALPILMDESLISPADLIEMIRLDLLDGVAMKPAKSGGLAPAKRQWEIAEEAGLMILGSGLTDPDVSLAGTLALFGAYGYSRPAALNGLQFIEASVLKTPFTDEGGVLRVPTGPGLGVEVDESKVHALLRE